MGGLPVKLWSKCVHRLGNLCYVDQKYGSVYICQPFFTSFLNCDRTPNDLWILSELFQFLVSLGSWQGWRDKLVISPAQSVMTAVLVRLTLHGSLWQLNCLWIKIQVPAFQFSPFAFKLGSVCQSVFIVHLGA